jgi:hypothetical protein
MGTGRGGSPDPTGLPSHYVRNQKLAIYFWKQSTIICGRSGLELPDQPHPGAAVHRPRPGRAAARHRGGTGITGRTAYSIVTDLTEARYVVKHKDGRRNRYQIQAHLPLPETGSRERTIGEILALLTGADDEATA